MVRPVRKWRVSTLSRRRFLLSSLLAIAAGVLVIAVALMPSQKAKTSVRQRRPQPTTANVETPLLPPLPASRYLNAVESVEYVGTEKCIGCHAEQHESYLATAHSHSFARITSRDSIADGADESTVVTHSASHRRYKSEVDDQGMVQQDLLVLPSGEERSLDDYRIAYAIGSGRFAQSYLGRIDGFLVESPITWYSRRKQWSMSPGYDERDQSSFQRTVSDDCLLCHVGRTQIREHDLFKIDVLEESIGCERCHGPGAMHVTSRETGRAVKGEIDTTIVNPKNLSRELAEAICQQCHLQSQVSVAVRGRRMSEFKPGLPLEAFRVDFHRASDDPEMSVTGHVEQLHLSRCWQDSASLTCSSCHPSHRNVTNDRTWYRSACLKCHSEKSCGEQLSLRNEKRDDCNTCHMPQVPTEVPHVAFTHHRIDVYPSVQSIRKPAVGQLITVQNLEGLPAPDIDRCLGLAHEKLLPQSKNAIEYAQHLTSAEQLLTQVYSKGLRDPEVTAALANVARLKRNPAEAVRRATETIQAETEDGHARIEALRILGELRFQQKDFEGAANCYRQLTEARLNARDFYFLGMSEQELGEPDAAIRAFERSVKIDPLQIGGRMALVTLYKSKGDQRAANQQQIWVNALTGSDRKLKK